MADGWSTSPRFQQNRAVPASRRFLTSSREGTSEIAVRSRKSRFGDHANRGLTARSALEPELFDKPLRLAGTLGVVRLGP